MARYLSGFELITGHKADDVRLRMSELVDMDYEPQGGVSIATDQDYVYYAVLMVKWDNTTDREEE